MVACPQNHPLGNYDRALPGGGSVATAEEVAVGPQVGNKDAVVISLRPGTTAKPLFFYRPVEHPTWSKELTYTFSMPQSGTSLGDRGLPSVFSSAVRDTSGCDKYETVAPVDKRPSSERDLKELDEPKQIDDVVDQPPAPSDDAWKTEKQVLVSGSDALGCETKLKDQWFRASCEGKVSFTAAEVEREGRKTQTKVEVSDGKLSILTPYVEKTDFRVKVTFQGGERFFKLRWSPGKRPLEVGKFSDSR